MTKSKINVEVTDVRVYPVKSGKSSLLANASITIDGELVIWVKVIEGKKGNFVTFPNHSYKDGKETMYKDDVFCLNKSVYDYISDAVLTAYDEELND